MFLTKSAYDNLLEFPRKQQTRNSLDLPRKILHMIVVKVVIPNGTSQELVIDVIMILIWKIVRGNPIDYCFILMQHMRSYANSN